MAIADIISREGPSHHTHAPQVAALPCGWWPLVILSTPTHQHFRASRFSTMTVKVQRFKSSLETDRSNGVLEFNLPILSRRKLAASLLDRSLRRFGQPASAMLLGSLQAISCAMMEECKSKESKRTIKRSKGTFASLGWFAAQRFSGNAGSNPPV